MRPCLQYHIQDCHGRGQKEVTAVEVIDGGSQVTVITGSQNSCELRFCALKREDNPKRIYILRGDETSKYFILYYCNELSQWLTCHFTQHCVTCRILGQINKNYILKRKRHKLITVFFK